MAKKGKYYVVWKGHLPGIYESWELCKDQVLGVEQAKYKSFDTLKEAEQAFSTNPKEYMGIPKKSPLLSKESLKPTIKQDSLAVDAACSGNPGAMEYQGVYVQTGERVFHFGPLYGTNNIGEFLALVHGLALLKQKQLTMPIYTDSKIAIGWIKQKRCKTNLKRSSRSEEIFNMIERAETWLQTNTFTTKILKWETKEWGEIPADFGRK